MLSFRYQQISAVHKSKPKLAHLRTHLRDVMMQGGENYGPAYKKSLFDFSSLLSIKKFCSGMKLISLPPVLPAPLCCTCATPLLSAGLWLFSASHHRHHAPISTAPTASANPHPSLSLAGLRCFPAFRHH